MDKIVLPYHPHFGDVFGIAKTLYGTYVTPGWYLVPDGTTRDHIVFDPNTIIEKPIVQQDEPEQLKKTMVFQVEASKPGKFYNVEYTGVYWTCNCPAKQFNRGDCKHIKKIKENEANQAA